MLTAYRLEESRAQRIIFLLEELQLSYRVKCYKRQPDFSAPPDLRKIHPLGVSPILVIEFDDAREPLTMTESGWITEYLCKHYGGKQGLAPDPSPDGGPGAETVEYMQYKFYLQYAEGSLMPLNMVDKVTQGQCNVTDIHC